MRVCNNTALLCCITFPPCWITVLEEQFTSWEKNWFSSCQLVVCLPAIVSNIWFFQFHCQFSSWTMFQVERQRWSEPYIVYVCAEVCVLSIFHSYKSKQRLNTKSHREFCRRLGLPLEMDFVSVITRQSSGRRRVSLLEDHTFEIISPGDGQNLLRMCTFYCLCLHFMGWKSKNISSARGVCKCADHSLGLNYSVRLLWGAHKLRNPPLSLHWRCCLPPHNVAPPNVQCNL